MKSKKSKASEIKKYLEKGIPIKNLESGALLPPDEFVLNGVPSEPIDGIPFSPVELTPEELNKNNAHFEQLLVTYRTAGVVAPSLRKVIKFYKRDFNNDCTALTASGQKKAENLILNILFKECRTYGFWVSTKTTDRNKKNQLILDYVNTFLRAYEFLTETTIFSAEEAKERLRSYFVETIAEMFSNGDIE